MGEQNKMMIEDYIIQAIVLLWGAFWLSFFMFLMGLFLRLIDEKVIK